MPLINRTATVIRRSSSSETDRFGNKKHSETPVPTVCEIQQQRRDEHEGETSDTLWDVFFLAGTNVNSGDALVVDGEEYELIGDPWEARNPRTRTPSHIEATARRTRGPSDEGES